jgi:hypothetical protein
MPPPAKSKKSAVSSMGVQLKRWVMGLVLVSLQVQAFAQFTGPILRSGGTVKSGFAKNGTLMFGGQVLGNPHQLMHDMQNPTLWSTGAVSFSNSTDPTFVQATVDQMMQAIEPPSEPGGLFMSRLYLNPENPYIPGGALSAPPSPTPETGAAAPPGPLIDNFEHYQRVLAHAQANLGDRNQDITRWSQTNAERGDGVSYLAKTHTSSSAALRNTLFDSAPSRAVFQAAQVPSAGASGFFAIQGAQAKTHLANLQEQNAQLLGSRIFFSQQHIKTSLKKSQHFDHQLGLETRGTQLGYIQADGQTKTFEWGQQPFFAAQTAEQLGQSLHQAANLHHVWVQATADLNWSKSTDDHLFNQWLNNSGGENNTWEPNPSTFNSANLLSQLFNSGVGPNGLRHDGGELGCGCGDAKTDRFVPDVVFGVSLLDACRKHDQAYATFGASKVVADVQLGIDIAKAFHDAWGILGIPAGILVGLFYSLAVVFFGETAYESAQAKAQAQSNEVSYPPSPYPNNEGNLGGLPGNTETQAPDNNPPSPHPNNIGNFGGLP